MNGELSAAPLSASVRAEAAVWVARLHGSERSQALEAGFKRWLAADLAHAQAFELATEAWEIAGSVPGRVLPRIADPFSHRPRRRVLAHPYLAVTAVLSTVVVGTVFYLNREKLAVSTDIGEQRMLTLEDGSRIFLNTDTSLFVRKDPARRHVQLESGEALFDVTKNPKRPFVVTAGDREVVALGTSFVVRRDPHELTVTLVEGKVVVSPVGAAGNADELENHGEIAVNKTVMTPGQRLTFTSRKPPKLDEPPIEKVTAWRRGEVILDKTRLQDAVDEMNRYSGVKLVLDDPGIADIRIGGIFRAGDSNRFAQAVGETYHLAVVYEQRRIVISGLHH